MSEISFRKPLIINGISKVVSIIIQFSITAILSRILSPSDYGIVAVTTIFTNLFVLLSGMGIGPAIIQKRNLNKEDYDNIYTFSWYFALLLAIIFSILGFFLARLYNNNNYVFIGLILALSLLFNTVNMVPNGLLLKNQEFFKIAIRTISINVICGFLAVLMANFGFKYYTLVFNSLFNAVAIFLWNKFSIELSFKKRIKMSSIKKIISFSSYMIAFDFINYFSSNLDNILVTLFLGSTMLAYYDKSYQLMMYPVTLIGTVVSPILQPIFAKYQNDKEYIYKNYLSLLKILLILGCFVECIFLSSPREIINISFGDQWNTSIICFFILSFSEFFRIAVKTTGYVIQSINKVKLLFKTTIITTSTYFVCLIVGLYFKTIESLACSVSIAYILTFIISYLSFSIAFEHKIVSLFKDIRDELLLLVISIFIGILINKYFLIENIYLSLGVKSIVILFIFSIWIIFMKKIVLFKEILKN